MASEKDHKEIHEICSIYGSWQYRIFCTWKKTCHLGKWYHRTCWARNNELDKSENEYESYPALGCISALLRFAGFGALFIIVIYTINVLSSDDPDKFMRLMIGDIPLAIFVLIMFGIAELLKGIVRVLNRNSK
jgi:hypothetical protein